MISVTTWSKIFMEIKKYKELEKFIQSMNSREINLIIVKSKGGLGKTYSVSKELENPLVFTGHVTALEFYMTLYRNPTRLVVIDDVDQFFQNKTLVALMKQFTDTKEIKDVRYTTSATYEGEKVPQEFQSTNNFVMLVNNLPPENVHVKALLTRGFFIHFVPEKKEVFRVLKSFAEDKEIVNYLWGMLGKIKDFNFRIYEMCLDLKNSGQDWKTWLNIEYNDDKIERLLYEIKDMPKKQRDLVWKEESGLSIRSLQRRMKKIK